jgi:hypothetical protein
MAAGAARQRCHAVEYRRAHGTQAPPVLDEVEGRPVLAVQKALEEQGIDYEVVKGPARPGKRAELQRISGQKLYPVIEFENGAIYREESKDMAATIRAGRLDEKRGTLD